MEPNAILIPVSAGELADKITILGIKELRINDAVKSASIKTELALLTAEFAKLPKSTELERLTGALRAANEQIWDAEELVRQGGVADEQFLEWSKISHSGNDERFRLKSEINKLLGSGIVEVKSHQG